MEFCQQNALVIANTLFQLHKRRLYTWKSPGDQYRNQTDYIICSQKWRSSIQSAKTGLGADCGSDHELLIAKFRHKLKKVGETTRSFRYDLNQIPLLKPQENCGGGSFLYLGPEQESWPQSLGRVEMSRRHQGLIPECQQRGPSTGLPHPPTPRGPALKLTQRQQRLHRSGTRSLC